MYKYQSDFITRITKDKDGKDVTSSLGYSVILIDNVNARHIENTYHIISSYFHKGSQVFRDTSELRKLIALLKIEEDKG